MKNFLKVLKQFSVKVIAKMIIEQELIVKLLVIPVIVIINYLSMWYVCGFIGLDGIKPIGCIDAYGYVFPPNWFLVVILFLSVVEYVALITLFTLKQIDEKN